MGRDYCIIPDQHAHPDHHNDRADWLGKFIKDRRPDVVVNMGDAWDLPSLSSFDKGKASFHGASYERDINAGLDFQDRMWHPLKKSKKKMPHTVFLEGNHCHRISKVLEYEPHLAGERYGISYSNLQLDYYYKDIVMYEGQTPGIYTIDGLSFAHFFVSGLMGRPIGGDHHAASLLAKNYSSCVAAHSHTVDYAIRSGSNGKKIMGLVAGVYQDYQSVWAGNVNNLWTSCVCYLRNVDEGTYDLEIISLRTLKDTYGK